MDLLRETLTRAANELGFVLVGFARLRPLSEHEDFYRRWLADGGNASMTYLAREPERGSTRASLDARYRSVVSLGYPYAARATPEVDWRAEMRGRIAAYALGRDYHDVVKKRARAVGNVHPATASRLDDARRTWTPGRSSSVNGRRLRASDGSARTR